MHISVLKHLVRCFHVDSFQISSAYFSQIMIDFTCNNEGPDLSFYKLFQDQLHILWTINLTLIHTAVLSILSL